MLDFSEFKGLKNAVELKSALQQASNRSTPTAQREQRTAAEMLGLNPMSLGSSTFPVFNAQGEVFAGSDIGKNDYALQVKGSIKEGELIEFESESGDSKYGVVIEPPFLFNKQGVYVRDISKDEFTSILSKKKANVVKISESSLKKVKQPVKWGTTDSVQGFILSLFKETFKNMKQLSKIIGEYWLLFYLLILITFLILSILTLSEGSLLAFFRLFE
ncbi:MAG: hypothetical protein ACOX6V_02440 [Patescibacteria group bacterium]|jgi:hypothetical protein